MSWKNRCVQKSTSISSVLVKLNDHKGDIIYVLDKNKLLGTISDGDVRRFMIKSKSIHPLSQIPCEKVMNPNFKFLNQKKSLFDFDNILEFPEKIQSIPILDNKGNITDELRLGNSEFIPIAEPSFDEIERKYLLECFDSNFISSNSSLVNSFEKEFLSFLNEKNGTSVSNGTSALELILKSLNLNKKSVIGVPNFTFAASINAIINTGHIPLILDCKQNLLVDEDKIPWSELDALIYVSLYGNADNINTISNLCAQNSIPLIGDHAEGLGALYNGHHLDYYCDASSYSFFGNKLITTGEGGFVTFKSIDNFHKSLVIKNHGMNPEIKYNHIEIGSNFRLTGLQAAIGLGQLKKIESFLSKRRKIGKIYYDSFNGSIINPIYQNPQLKGSFWLFPILVQEDQIENLTNWMNDCKIEVRRIFQPLSEMTIYHNYCIHKHHYNKYHGIVLPTHPTLSEIEIFRIIQHIKKWEKQLQ